MAGDSDDAITDFGPDAELACSGPGSLDPSFGIGGIVPEVFGQVPAPLAGASAVALDPSSDHIVVAGSAPTRDGRSGLALIRLDADGRLDPSFGTDGISQVGVPEHDCWLEDVVVQPDGKILGVGGINGETTSQLLLARFDADGSLDASFGTNGLVFAQPAPFSHGIALAQDSDGNAVVAAQSWAGSAVTDPAYITTVRYLPTGLPDPTFGSAGVAEPGSANGQDVAQDIAIDPDVNIVVVGHAASPSGTIADIGAIRYLPDGTLDFSFNSTGTVTVGLDTGSIAYGVAIDTQGRFVLVGSSSLSGVAVRSLGDGQLDPAFGTAGHLLASVASGLTFQQVTISPADGKLVAAGWSVDNGQQSFAVARIETEGDLDPSFGQGGLTMTSSSTDDLGFDLAVQDDGRIVVVGYQFSGSPAMPLADFRVARYCP